MNILITGAGSIGIAMAALLKKAGQQVSIYATGATYAAIAADGVHMTGLFGCLDYAPVAFTLTDSYGKLPQNHFDYILICAKTMANPAIAAALNEHRAILRPEGKLVIMQNGWGNDKAYLDYFSPEQIYSARVITGFQRTAPNASNITVHTAPILLGSLHGCPAGVMEPLADAIAEGGIPCQASDEISKALWAKMLYNCTLNPLGAIVGVHYGALTECKQSVAIMNDTMDEIFAVMHAAGYSTYWPDADAYRKDFYSKLIPDTYNHNSSTRQDILAHRITEIDTLTGRILELAAQHGVAVPVNTMLYRLIKSLEANY